MISTLDKNDKVWYNTTTMSEIGIMVVTQRVRVVVTREPHKLDTEVRVFYPLHNSINIIFFLIKGAFIDEH